VYVDSLGAFDISAYHATGGVLATYANLQAALGTNGANIPEALRKGGMSVKFVQETVQSSDNNYVQFRCMADEFTTNTDDWSFMGDDVLVECPEYVAVYTDADGKIILAVENDGNIHFGAGVPEQVIDYINEKIAELSLDEYEDIVAFLGTLINGDKTLAELLDEKVDKVEGKSLIDEDVANGASYVENPEFINVELDADGNIIKATKNDGTEYFGVGIDIAGVSCFMPITFIKNAGLVEDITHGYNFKNIAFGNLIFNQKRYLLRFVSEAQMQKKTSHGDKDSDFYINEIVIGTISEIMRYNTPAGKKKTTKVKVKIEDGRETMIRRRFFYPAMLDIEDFKIGDVIKIQKTGFDDELDQTTWKIIETNRIIKS
jgi:hypothetical protein